VTAPLRVLLPSDVFPPRCGGAGWSAHALALALIERGHAVTAVVPRRRTKDQRRGTRDDSSALGPSSFIFGPEPEEVLGVPTIRLDYWAPRIPIVQNYFRYERFWPRLAEQLVEVALRPQHPALNVPLLIHAQHVQTAPASVAAARRLGAPVVVTVRDHWPWDYFSTGLHGDRLPYARQSWAALATDLVARLGPARGALALPALPYMLAHVRRRQQALRHADAVIAVSDYMARRLAGLVAPERLHVIPNMVDLAAIDAATAAPQTTVPSETPYLLFVGKLERNKGAHLLIDIFRTFMDESQRTKDEGPNNPIDTDNFEDQSNAGALVLGRWSLVVAGSGPLRAELERELAALGVRARFLDWVEHDEVLRLMAGCELLLFPSAWGEPLSRVPLEASACGAAILAMPTGGTPSIIADGVNGALEPTVAGFARRMAALLAAPEQRRALGTAARRNAEQRFAKRAVVGQVEQLYRALGGR
jgi:glycosyltransferase involved in cell wall biosynthesis